MYRLLLFLFISFLFACSQSSPSQKRAKETNAEFSTIQLTGNETPDQLLAEIKKLHSEFKSVEDPVMKKEKGVSFIQTVKTLATRFPSNIEIPKYLSIAAEAGRAINEINEALALYGQVYQAYPDHPLAAPALFLQGFILENELSQKDHARANYELFLEKYPDHEFAKTVQLSLDQIDMSPQELIKQFRSENKK